MTVKKSKGTGSIVDECFLEKDDVAIVFKAKGGMELVLPKFEDDDAPVSDAVMEATALVFLLDSGNKQFIKLINDTITQVVKEATAEEKNVKKVSKKLTKKKTL